MKTEQPLWGRGIMVSPQHFQQQAAYAAWSAECIARLGLNHPWGVIESTFESDMLKLGRLQAHRLHVRFQDGSLIDTDNADALPPALSLDGEAHDTVVVLALPLLRANGGNCLTPDEVADRPVRLPPALAGRAQPMCYVQVRLKSPAGCCRWWRSA
nr:type VI secretion protein [Raoultella sp. NCTC 9187]